MNTATENLGVRLFISAVAMAAFVLAFDAHAQLAHQGLELTERPNFRTDLGVQLAFGGNSCIGGGSGYADCNDVNYSWDTNVGFSGGLMVRPFSKFSFGIDISYVRMTHHQWTQDRWADFTVGPSVRGHLPMYISGILIEPNLGLQVGYVSGTYFQNGRQGTNEKDYEHRHVGLFFAPTIGTDVFIPGTSFGVGFEVRLLRTAYEEVCFEWSEGSNCRGVSDENIVRTYNVEWDDELKMEVVKNGTKFPGEKGLADYPWKLFYGLHVVYYF